MNVNIRRSTAPPKRRVGALDKLGVGHKLLALFGVIAMALAPMTATAGSDAVARGLAAKGIAAVNAIPLSRVVAATRAGVLGGVSTQLKTDGTVASATYRNWHQTASAAMTDIVVCYANWSWTPSGEVIGDNAITVKAALEYNSKSFPLYFRGQRTATIDPGGTACSDPSGIRVAASSSLWDRVYVTNNGVASGTWAIGRQATTNGFESNNYIAATGADAADSTGQVSGSSFTGIGGYQFGAVAITGRPAAATPVFAFQGDSIASGAGDTNSAVIGYYGFLERGFSNTYPWVSLTRAGFRGVHISSDQSRSAALIGREQGSPSVTAVVNQLGVNDIFAQNSTLTALQANELAIWNTFAAAGTHVFQTTITPDTSSTDGWTSVSGQTTVNSTQETVRENFNDWLRCGAPISSGVATTCGAAGATVAGQSGHPLKGYVEIADVVESARNSGKWAVNANARTVTDAVCTASSATITSATANFTTADIGTQVYLTGCAAASGNLSATITARGSATSITINTNASTAQAATTLKMGGNTADGLHPSLPLHTSAAAVISAGAASGQIS